MIDIGLELQKAFDEGYEKGKADRPQEWIPCSERLPSEFSDDERVLATTEVDGLGVILMPAYDVKSWYLKGYITAWMPLPKPWKGADDYERAIEQTEHDMLYEPTYNSEDGSM